MAETLTYNIVKEKVSSEKTLLAWVEPFKRAVTWINHSGAIYKRSSEFVIDVLKDQTSLTEASDSTLDPGEWFYDAEVKLIYIRLSDDSDPEASNMVLNLRYFFSDRPTIATHDLTDSGIEVEYQGLIQNNPSFPKEIDPATQLGLALESKGSLQLENNHGFFDPIFDTLFWINKRVVIFSYFPITPISEKKKIFQGFINDKKHTPALITFPIVDQVLKLRSEPSLGTFSNSDGTISSDIIGTPKRRLYGEVKGVSPQSLDQVLNGFQITGTISGSEDGLTVTGIATNFLEELSPEDTLTLSLNAEEIEVTVDKVQTDLAFTVAFGLSKGFNNVTAINNPERSYRKYNRVHHLAGHKLREPTTTITEVLSNNRLRLDSVADLFAGNAIEVNNIPRFIRRVTEDVIVLNQSMPAPAIGQTVKRNPINDIFFNQRRFVIDRDYTLSNAAEAIITLTDDAEFNQTFDTSVIGTSVTFANGSRTVIGVGTKFLSEFKSRDYIVSDDITHQTYYEILQVNDDEELELRVAYAGTNNVGDARKKNVKYIGDDSTIIVDCLGKEDALGNWIKTASDVIKDLVVNDASLGEIDEASFDQAKEDVPFIMALKLLLDKAGKAPIIREVINLVNKSVLGSLISQSDFTIAYNVLFPEKPADLTEFKDHDIVGDPKFISKTKIARRVYVTFDHFDADINSLEKGNDFDEFENDFVDLLVGTQDSLNVDLYLSRASDAVTMLQRYAFYYSLSQSIIEIKTKMNLALANLGDKIFISLDRLFSRFGAANINKKIGVITKLVKSSTDTIVTFTDLANVHDRVGTIADDSSNDFTSASDTEKILNGYIVDNSTELPDSAAITDDEWGTNLIG